MGRSSRSVPRWALAAVGLAVCLALGGLAAAAPTPSAASHVTHRMPHPWAVRAPASAGLSPSYSGHYWAGAYYTGTSANATKLAMTLTIPNGEPNSGEFYYVLLSGCDNAGSYDQVGISNTYGTWGFTYSYTSACAGNYYYSPDYVALTPGVTYHFSMSISSTGYVTYKAVHGSTSTVSLTFKTGGTAFVDQSFYSCSSSTYYDLTDYEEIYTTVQSMPSFDFAFRANAANGTAITAWSSMGSPLGGGTILTSGATVTVANEPFSLAFGAGASNYANPPKHATSYATSVAVGRVVGSGNVSLTYGATMPGAFNVTFTPASGAAGFNSSVLIHFVSVTRGATYVLYFTGTNATGAYSYVTLDLHLR